MIKNIFLGLTIIATSPPVISGVTYWGLQVDLWNKNKSHENIIYVQGVFDGLVFAETKVMDVELTTEIDIKQYKTGVDKLYADEKNSRIPVPFLLQIISLEHQGTDKGTIEKLLQLYRKKFSI